MKIEIDNGVILLSATQSWEELVREELGNVEIGHNTSGIPLLISESKFQISNSYFRISDLKISVSHTNGMTAVLLSDAPCGIDTERNNRNSSFARERYFLPDEQTLSDSPLYPCVAWCAREALYKRLEGRRGEALMARMRIAKVDLEHNKIVLSLNDQLYEIKIFLHGDYVIACTIG